MRNGVGLGIGLWIVDCGVADAPTRCSASSQVGGDRVRSKRVAGKLRNSGAG